MLAEDGVDVYWGQNQMMPPTMRHQCLKVLTVHDLTGILYPRMMTLRHRLSWCRNFRSAVRVADRLVVVSEATARLISVFFGPRARSHVVYPGHAGEFTMVDARSARESVMQEFGIPADYYMTVGTIEPRKDHLTLLRATKLTRSELPLVIVGAPGWNCSQVMAEIQRQSNQGRVVFLGRVSDKKLRLLYGAAKLSVYPSLYEGFGSPVLEAMACGCPVLCSWSSSLPEVGGSAVSYFRRRDAVDLGAKIDELLGDERRLEVMRAAGLDRAAQFSYARTARQLLSYFRGSS
jgi:alpha-1,3-rhamnosyl/mannosyltransferase